MLRVLLTVIGAAVAVGWALLELLSLVWAAAEVPSVIRDSRRHWPVALAWTYLPIGMILACAVYYKGGPWWLKALLIATLAIALLVAVFYPEIGDARRSRKKPEPE